MEEERDKRFKGTTHRMESSHLFVSVSLPLPSLSSHVPICLHITFLFLSLAGAGCLSQTNKHTHTHTHTQLSPYPVFVNSYITTGSSLIKLYIDLACVKLLCYLNYIRQSFGIKFFCQKLLDF